MTEPKADSANPVEIGADALSVAMMYQGFSDETRRREILRNRSLNSAYVTKVFAALEAAGFRIVHPEMVTERMASAAGEEVLAQYSACMHWEEAKDVVEGLDDASVISVAIVAAPTYATPAALQKE